MTSHQVSKQVHADCDSGWKNKRNMRKKKGYYSVLYKNRTTCGSKSRYGGPKSGLAVCSLP